MSFRKPFRAVPIRHLAHGRAKARRPRKPSYAFVLTLFGGAVVSGGLIGIGSVALPKIVAPTNSSTVSGCTATDGDTIRCGNERIRLVGIDAPELPGHCRKGRRCAPGNPYSATDSLRTAITGNLQIERLNEDRYGRTIAAIANDRGNLSCMQLRSGNAVYVARWDNDERIARTCPEQVRRR